jgi:DNA-binding beta-propeller fold protein YncE
VAVAPDGTVYVLDAGNNRIQTFDASGTFLGTWGSPGSGEGQLGAAFGMAVAPDGIVYVVEQTNRVQVFAPDGTPLGAWGELGSEPGQFQEPRGIALDGQGGAYVTEWLGRRVQKFRLLPPLG